VARAKGGTVERAESTERDGGDRGTLRVLGEIRASVPSGTLEERPYEIQAEDGCIPGCNEGPIEPAL